MTRREDPIWDSDTAASRGNADSMHVTNAVPQMQPFNAGIWLDLEDYALQNAWRDDMKISVFTGPFLDDDDPTMFGVQVPVEFWKVIAFVHDETASCAPPATRCRSATFSARKSSYLVRTRLRSGRSARSSCEPGSRLDGSQNWIRSRSRRGSLHTSPT
jgi:DNA/RNA endonuclease G (NUC1)